MNVSPIKRNLSIEEKYDSTIFSDNIDIKSNFGEKTVRPGANSNSRVCEPAKKIGKTVLKIFSYTGLSLLTISTATIYLTTSPLSSTCLAIINGKKLYNNVKKIAALKKECAALSRARIESEGSQKLNSFSELGESNPTPPLIEFNDSQNFSIESECLETQIDYLSFRAKKNKENIAASVLAIIPLVGHLTAAIYLKNKNPRAQGIGDALVESCLPEDQTLTNAFFYPLAIKNRKNGYMDKLEKLRNKTPFLRGNTITIDVDRGVVPKSKISAVEVPSAGNEMDYTKPIIVIFHANAQTALDLKDHATFYTNLGFNALTVTMGGYPGSDETIETSEVSSYQDADAAIRYLIRKGSDKIGVHGISIGGMLAFAAAELHPGIVKLVIADQTFDTIENIAVNVFKHMGIPSFIARGAARSVFFRGKPVPGVLKNGEIYRTDGADNLKKARSITQGKMCEVFAIKSREDWMTQKKDQNGVFIEDFADGLIRAIYENDDSDLHMLTLNGGHCDWITSPDSNHVDRFPLIKQLYNTFKL
jgi:hypothetical protein